MQQAIVVKGYESVFSYDVGLSQLLPTAGSIDRAAELLWIDEGAWL